MTNDPETITDLSPACPHGEPVKWNPYNGVVQCHRCGKIFVPINLLNSEQYNEWLEAQMQRYPQFREMVEMARASKRDPRGL